MAISNIRKKLIESRRTPEYQFEKVLLDITEDIYELMQDRGITKSYLAERLGKSKPWVTKLLSGDQNMTVKTLTNVFWELGDTITKIQHEPRSPVSTIEPRATVTVAQTDASRQGVVKKEWPPHVLHMGTDASSHKDKSTECKENKQETSAIAAGTNSYALAA